MRKLFCVGLLALAVCTGCGSSSSTGSGKISVTVTPNANPVSVGVTLTQQFTASVSGTSNQAVTWTVSGASCTGAACGTISSAGLYTAPAAVPSPHATVTITAASQAAPSQTRVVNVRIVDILVSLLPSSATVALNGTQQFNAQVNPLTSVTYSLSGAGCAGATCGTISSSGLYTAPSGLPNPPSVTVKATSTAEATASATALITLVSSFNSRVKGTYAFHFSGFDAGGAVYSAGIFTADGSGLISAGVEDINRSSGAAQAAFTGSYVVGSDNRGTLTLVSGSVTSIYKFAIGASGEAIFIESDVTGTRGTGVFDKADSTAFSNSAISGPFVMGLSGNDQSNKHVGIAGMITTDGAAPTGNITLGSVDLNDAGAHLASATLSGFYAVASNGRGTMQITATALSTTYNFAFYVVANAELFIVSTDPVSASNPRVGGIVIGQAVTPFSNSTFNGNAVFNLIGFNSTPASVVALGILGTDGSGNLTSGSMFDENNAGAVVAQQALAGTYNIATTGMGTVTVTSANPPASSFVIYAVTTNKGFLLDVSSSNALFGFIEPQIAGNGGTFSPATIQGTFVTGTTTDAITSATNISGVLSLDGSSSITGTQDESTPTMNTSMQSVAASYAVSTNGRGTEAVSSPAASNRVLYVVNGSKFITIGVDAGDTAATVIESER